MATIPFAPENPTSVEDALHKVGEEDVRIVVLFATALEVQSFLRKAVAEGMVGKGWVRALGR